MNLTEALETQAEMFKFSLTSNGVKNISFWWERKSEGAKQWFGSNGINARNRVLLEQDTFRNGDLFWIKQDIIDLALNVLKIMPNQSVLESDLPTSTGIMIFENPILVKDNFGKNMAYSATSWRKFKNGILWVHYTDVDDSRDHAYLDFQNKRSLFPRFIEVAEDFETFGNEDFKDSIITDINSENIKILKFFRRFPLCMISIMQQCVSVSISKEKAERHGRKRIKKQGLPQYDNLINVVVLRKLRIKDEHKAKTPIELEKVEWSHRWEVEPYWRNTWYPSLNAHRRQLVTGYTSLNSNPDYEHLPILTKKKVYKVQR